MSEYGARAKRPMGHGTDAPRAQHDYLVNVLRDVLVSSEYNNNSLSDNRSHRDKKPVPVPPRPASAPKVFGVHRKFSPCEAHRGTCSRIAGCKTHI